MPFSWLSLPLLNFKWLSVWIVAMYGRKLQENNLDKGTSSFFSIRNHHYAFTCPFRAKFSLESIIDLFPSNEGLSHIQDKKVRIGFLENTTNMFCCALVLKREAYWFWLERVETIMLINGRNWEYMTWFS